MPAARASAFPVPVRWEPRNQAGRRTPVATATIHWTASTAAIQFAAPPRIHSGQPHEQPQPALMDSSAVVDLTATTGRPEPDTTATPRSLPIATAARLSESGVVPVLLPARLGESGYVRRSVVALARQMRLTNRHQAAPSHTPQMPPVLAQRIAKAGHRLRAGRQVRSVRLSRWPSLWPPANRRPVTPRHAQGGQVTVRDCLRSCCGRCSSDW